MGFGGVRRYNVDMQYEERTADVAKVESNGLTRRVKRLVTYHLAKYRILNFMVVGGIGFVVNMIALWLLTPTFKSMLRDVFNSETNFLGQHFYLPSFLVSSLIAIVCNYVLNKVWTFRDLSAHSQSFLRYLSMALLTLVPDMVLLYVFVAYGGLPYMLGAALAIMIVFVIRYTIARRWIWHDGGPGPKAVTPK